MSVFIVNSSTPSGGSIGGSVNLPGATQPTTWTPDETADWLAVEAAVSASSEVHLTGTDADGITSTTAIPNGTAVTDGDDVGFWPNGYVVEEGMTGRAGYLPTWDAAEDAVEFVQPSGLGRALFLQQDILATKWHILICFKSTDNTKTVAQCLLQIPAVRILTNKGSTYNLQTQIISGGVESNIVIRSGASSDWTMLEIRRDGSTFQYRTNGQAWTSTTTAWANWGQQGDAVNDIHRSMIGRSSYTDETFTDYVSWDGLVNGVIVSYNDWLEGTDNEAARRLVSRGQTIADLDPVDPPDPPPPSGDEPGSTGTATTTVNNYSELVSAINSANPGDIIEATNGTYSGSRIVVDRNGTAQNPIVIRAQNILGANVPGGWNLSGQNIVIRGFDMDVGTGPSPMIFFGGTDNQVWRCRIRCRRDQVMFMNGSGGRFMYNELTNPAPTDHFQANQHVLRGWFNTSTHHYNAEIGYNYFHDYPSKPAGVGYHEFRRFGIAAGSLYFYMFYEQNWHLHHNLLENGGSMRFACYGSSNLWEFNTVTGQSIPGSPVSCDFNQRIGRNNTWRGNWAEGTRVGHHIHGGPHTIISHKVVNGGSIEVFAGDRTPDELTERYPNAFNVKLTACEAPIIVGRSWGSFMTRPAENTRVEGHISGGVSLTGSQTGTVQTGVVTETPVTPIKMTPGMVGPFGTGVP